MLMLAALLLELLLGWPQWLFSRIAHPVVWMGALISALERRLNRDTVCARRRFVSGMFSSLLVVSACAGIASLLPLLLPDNLFGFVLEALIASSMLASRSLYQHVAAVVQPLCLRDLPAARKAVSMIVGRDTGELQETGISAAALESLAENASDGVIAPLFWGLICGLPGLAAYKAINTLDSMIGHKTMRYQDYGRFAARLDDVVNWVPARVTALLFWLADAARVPFGRITHQAAYHRSPNAGWPESAMAFALGIRLSGPRVYHGGASEEPWLNPGGAAPGLDDLRQGLGLYRRAVLLSALLLLLVGLLLD